MKVNISAEAEADLIEIYEYIARDSQKYAREILIEIRQACAGIGDFPKAGRVVTKTNNPDVRESFFRRYRIAYWIMSDRIEILTVRHTARAIED